MADAKDFLFEIGTEEMPSAPLNNAVKQLGTMIAKGLDEAGLAHGEVRVISSPRRLAALVANVATATDEEFTRSSVAPRPTLPSTLTVTPPRPPRALPASAVWLPRTWSAARTLTVASMCSPRRTFLRTGYADSDRSVREDYCRPAVAQLSLPALGPRARDVRASGPLDLLPFGRGCCSRVVCRRDEWQHHAWSSRTWPW